MIDTNVRRNKRHYPKESRNDNQNHHQENYVNKCKRQSSSKSDYSISRSSRRKSNYHLSNSYLTFSLALKLILSILISINSCSGSQLAPAQATSATVTENATTEEHLLISNPVASSYVDFHTDNPILLFDGLSNNETNSTTDRDAGETSTTTTSSTINLISSTPIQESISEKNNNISIQSIASGENKVITTTPSGYRPETGVTTTEPGEDDEDNSESEGDGDTEPEGPGDKIAADSEAQFVPPQNVSQYMDYIERLFHDFRHQITYLFEPHIPQLIRTSQMVELTPSCSHDILRMALALRQLEPWALRMIDSSGKLPEGIFEGSFTSLGSYDQCLNILFTSSGATNQQSSQSDSKQQANGTTSPTSLVTQGKYCLVNVSPFLPPKPSPFERVDKLFQEEANRRNYSKDDQLSRLSPMFYYMRFRIGICVPSTCDYTDMSSISQALSSSLKLNITIDTCRFKQTDISASTHQLVAGSIAAAIIVLVLAATLLDYWHHLSEKLLRKRAKCEIVVLGLPEQQARVASIGLDHQTNIEARSNDRHQNHFHPNDSNDSMRPMSRVLRLPGSNKSKSFQVITDFGTEVAMKRGEVCQPGANWSMTSRQQKLESGLPLDDCRSGLRCYSQQAYSRCSLMVDDDWTWRSFSLIANFRLYFRNTHNPNYQYNDQQQAPQSQFSISSHHQTQADQRTPPTTDQAETNNAEAQFNSHPLIHCLNGIRVISLCWVIVANSYITLDPRATKGLTKTREAPRDFMFQLIVQASLAIETFFFLSGLLMSLSFSRHQLASSIRTRASKSTSATKFCLKSFNWLRFYLHRYIRLTAPAMLVIAFTMFAFRYGDGPLWYEVTHRAHLSCNVNWWRHLLHVANYIDTRQMCFIHYWYIAADMQLFLIAPILLLLLNKFARLGMFVIISLGVSSVAWIFHTTFMRNLPPTLLFYSSDPESRREFGNTIMTKPYTHLLPYLVGMLLGNWLINQQQVNNKQSYSSKSMNQNMDHSSDGLTNTCSFTSSLNKWKFLNVSSNTMMKLFGLMATLIVMAEIFLPYLWNNSKLPSPFLAALYAALFRLGWALALAYLVISCRHRPTNKCCSANRQQRQKPHQSVNWCWCGSAGSLLNQFLSWNIFNHLSRLSFIAYLIHLPLMSLFVAQTRAIFAFSHMLVIHLALSYLLMTFILSFILVHIIEFPFITLERYLYERTMFVRSKQSHNRKKSHSYITSLANERRQQRSQMFREERLATARNYYQHDLSKSNEQNRKAYDNSFTELQTTGDNSDVTRPTAQSDKITEYNQ